MKSTFLALYFKEQTNPKQPKVWIEMFEAFQSAMDKLPEDERDNLRTMKAEYKAVNNILDRSEKIWCFTSSSTDIINLDDEPDVFKRLSTDPEELNNFLKKVKKDEYTYIYQKDNSSQFEVFLSVSSIV